MRAKNMKFSLAQTNIVWEDKEANFDEAKNLINLAKINESDAILFPEMSFTGFTMNVAYSAEDNEDTVTRIRELAEEQSITIGFGWVKRAEKRAENHYTIVNEMGIVLSDYVKIHPFSCSEEDKYFNGGTKITQYCIGNIPFSTFICYDLRFPEVFQIASKNAHCIIVPANWPKRRSEHWKALLKARAIENQVYIIGINCCGRDIGGIEYSGGSCVINPNGEELIYSNESGLLYCELVDDALTYRNCFPVKKDRREKLYFELGGYSLRNGGNALKQS